MRVELGYFDVLSQRGDKISLRSGRDCRLGVDGGGQEWPPYTNGSCLRVRMIDLRRLPRPDPHISKSARCGHPAAIEAISVPMGNAALSTADDLHLTYPRGALESKWLIGTAQARDPDHSSL